MAVTGSWQRRGASMAGAVLLALATVSCGDDDGSGDGASGADMTPEEAREQTTTQAREVATVLRDAGMEPAAATGEYRTCRSEPSPGLEYPVSFAAQGEGDLAAQVTALSEALQEAGWSVTAEGSEPEVFANLERDGVRVATGESTREPGAVGVSVSGACADASDDDMALLGEPEDVDLS